MPDPAVLPDTRTHCRVWLWAPAAVALAVRLALLVGSGALWAGPSDPVVIQFDTAEYHILGRVLAETGRYHYDEADPLAERRPGRWEPEPLRPPGYPAFLAGVYRLAGPQPGVALALHTILEALTCLLLAVALRGALGCRGASIAALVYALHPGTALFASMLLSEALFTTCLVGGFALLVHALGDRQVSVVPGIRWGTLATAGVVLGLATLVRPVLQVVPLAMVPVLLVTQWPRARYGAAAAAVFAIAFGLTLVPWMARNAAEHGVFSLSTSGAYNLLILYAAPVEAAATGTPVRDVERALFARAEAAARHDGVPVRSDFDRALYWSAEAVRVFQRHPVAFVRQQASGVVRLFVSTGRLYRMWVVRAPGGVPPAGAGPAGLARWWAGQPLVHRVLDVWTVLFALVAYPLLAVGLVRAVRMGRRWPRALALAAVLGATLLVVTGTPGHSRFMVPIVPFWAPFVALGTVPRRRDTLESNVVQTDHAA